MRLILIIIFVLCSDIADAQLSTKQGTLVIRQSFDSSRHTLKVPKQFLSTIDFLDAAINSINSFNSLLKKEAYRIKITSLNNPTSSDMGFNLENEVQTALKPLLEKAKNTNTNKFSGIVSSILGSNAKSGLGKTLTSLAYLSHHKTKSFLGICL